MLAYDPFRVGKFPAFNVGIRSLRSLFPTLLNLSLSATLRLSLILYLFTPDTERIGYPINVIEPGRNQGDLQYRGIVKPDLSQALVMRRRNFDRVFCELNNVIAISRVRARSAAR